MSTISASASSAASARTSPRRSSSPAACASTSSTSRPHVPARASLLTGQPPRRRHGLVTATYGLPALRRPGFPAGGASRACATPGYATRAIGKWHLVPLSAPAPSAGRWGWASSATTASSPVTPMSGPPSWCARTRGRAAAQPGRGLPPDRGPGRRGDPERARPAPRHAREAVLPVPRAGAVHAPHQVPPEWIARQRGRFDLGWEAWRERVFARQQELGVVPAGAGADRATALGGRLARARPRTNARSPRGSSRRSPASSAHAEHAQLRPGWWHPRARGPARQHALVLYLSDNGASGEGVPGGLFNEHSFMADRDDEIARSVARLDEIGGPRAYNHYPWGWAWAGNAPFLWKRLAGRSARAARRALAEAHRGGAVRTQFHLFPTVLAATGGAAPPRSTAFQRALDGASLLGCIDDAAAPRRATRSTWDRRQPLRSRAAGSRSRSSARSSRAAAKFYRWSLFHLDSDSRRRTTGPLPSPSGCAG